GLNYDPDKDLMPIALAAVVPLALVVPAKAQFDENLTHVPYKGAGPALNDVIGNHVDFYFPGFPAAVPHVKGGTVKMLALSFAKRSAAAPDVPTVAEVTGIKDYDFTLWAGFFAPRGTPQPVIERLNKEINKV